ncbi:MAG TPA: MFS transporter, partial [Nocardioidaceae bacterium]
MTARPAPLAELSADERRKEQHAWYFYDWANSAYVTTVGTVLFSPYLTSVAERAACGRVGTDENPCDTNLHVLGLAISPGSMVFYVVTISTIFSALILPIVGAAADRTGRYKSILAGFAWSGSALAAAMFFVTGTNWQLGALLLVGANLCLGSSLVVYNAILVQIATPDERDRVSTRGWSLGYLGGGVLLALNLVLVLGHSAFGLDKAMAVRVCLFSAAVWWAGFTIIPFRGLRNLPPADVSPGTGGLARSSFSQLWRTLREMVGFPVLMLFLVASLFINDGVQTVTVASSTYGEKQLGFDTSVLIATILMVQFVAFGGALLFGAAAKVFGAKAGIIVALALWIVIVVIAF